MNETAKRQEDRLQFLTWDRKPDDIDSPAHQARKRVLVDEVGAQIADTAYIAAEAKIFPSSLTIGDRTWIAGYALVRGNISFGADCTVNPYACISGTVSFGNGVRIASHATIVGFNHGFEDPNTPIHKQTTHSQGITIEDDVWIGANAVILDGVTIAKGAVIAAGAVVTKNVPPLTIMAGSPARAIRKRGDRTSTNSEVLTALTTIGEKARDQHQALLKNYNTPEGYLAADGSGQTRKSIRHLCDAIEIAAGFNTVPDGLDKTKAIAELQAVQDPETGLLPDPFQPPKTDQPLRENGLALYNILAVGYALENLGSYPKHAISAVELNGQDLCQWLENLTWKTRAWGAGAAIDAIGTALYFNARYFTSGRTRETLFGWLALNDDRTTGLWGSPTTDDGWLQPVNGFYRLTRGTYAQFGLPVPYPEAAINSVLTNYKNYNGFEGEKRSACNLLDTIHPLWLLLKQTDHRRPEAEAIARNIILAAPERWQENRGLPFTDGHPPSLQGTEMWLSILHLSAQVLNLADNFPFTPKGVHRTKPVGFGV